MKKTFFVYCFFVCFFLGFNICIVTCWSFIRTLQIFSFTGNMAKNITKIILLFFIFFFFTIFILFSSALWLITLRKFFFETSPSFHQRISKRKGEIEENWNENLNFDFLTSTVQQDDEHNHIKNLKTVGGKGEKGERNFNLLIFALNWLLSKENSF